MGVQETSATAADVLETAEGEPLVVIEEDRPKFYKFLKICGTTALMIAVMFYTGKAERMPVWVWVMCALLLVLSIVLSAVRIRVEFREDRVLINVPKGTVMLYESIEKVTEGKGGLTITKRKGMGNTHSFLRAGFQEETWKRLVAQFQKVAEEARQRRAS